MNTVEPQEITAGDTIEWKKSLADYPASDGWILTYRLRGSRNYGIDNSVATIITTDADDFLISIPAVITASYAAGDYWLFGFVTNGSVRKTVIEVRVTVLPDAQAASQAFDGRSHAKKMLDAIESMLEGTASREEQSYQIDIQGKMRQLSFFSRDELIRFRNFYKNEYNRELSAERIAAGKGGGRKILVRFK
jgi:hypothetical protein